MCVGSEIDHVRYGRCDACVYVRHDKYPEEIENRTYHDRFPGGHATCRDACCDSIRCIRPAVYEYYGKRQKCGYKEHRGREDLIYEIRKCYVHGNSICE